jgi:hypothetical protein
MNLLRRFAATCDPSEGSTKLGDLLFDNPVDLLMQQLDLRCNRARSDPVRRGVA